MFTHLPWPRSKGIIRAPIDKFSWSLSLAIRKDRWLQGIYPLKKYFWALVIWRIISHFSFFCFSSGFLFSSDWFLINFVLGKVAIGQQKHYFHVETELSYDKHFISHFLGLKIILSIDVFHQFNLFAIKVFL